MVFFITAVAGAIETPSLHTNPQQPSRNRTGICGARGNRILVLVLPFRVLTPIDTIFAPIPTQSQQQLGGVQKLLIWLFYG
jgi:hypothetical protein